MDISNLFGIKIDYFLDLSDDIELTTIKYKYDTKVVADKIKEIRAELGLSLRKASEQFHISFNSISRYERGIRKLNAKALYNICRATNYNVDWILGLSIDKYKN